MTLKSEWPTNRCDSSALQAPAQRRVREIWKKTYGGPAANAKTGRMKRWKSLYNEDV